MRKISIFLSLMIVALFIGGEAYGQSVTVGGRLYDKWWKAAGVDEPRGNQPLWLTQSTNTRSGSTTWRCKECHGWDYKGAAGAYGSGSHFTGFAGVLDAATQLSVAELTAWLDGTTNPDHDFSAMGEDQLSHLARFLSEGLVDVAPFIDAQTKAAVGGDAAHGRQLYAICAACHGADGTTINFSGDPADPEFVGTVAAGNPWEFIHKVRLGQPGSNPPMPAGVDLGWSMDEVVDVLAYAQSLPTGAPPAVEPQVTIGGRLYDKWWKAAGVDEPRGNQPLWLTQSTNTRSGSTTWRCKECHGWDYKGAAGAYGSGSHFTGFAGVLDAATQLSVAELTAWLDGTTNPDHDFSAMGADQLSHLARFLSEGLVDVAPFIDAQTRVAVGGDAAHGRQLYAICAACHGADGTTINFSGDPADPEFVGTIAAGNPWEFIHKVRLGQPGSNPPMPAGVDLGWSMDEVVDVLAYAQSLPTGAPPAVEPQVTIGGRLYDKWWKAAGVDEPRGNQPLWLTQSTNTRSGSTTWRCKECHGWDYKGAAGAYGSGSHFTGFAGVLDAATQLSVAELTAWLDGTTNPDHDFSAMGADQLSHLARFLSEGLVDVAPFIDAQTKAAVGGDAAHGRQLYAICAACHGADGTTINFSGDPADPEFVGTIAAGNPWEFIHKVRLGQPGSNPPMPAGVDLGWSMDEVVDVLAYAQSLPTEIRPPIMGGYYGVLRVLESGASAGGLTVSGSAAGGRAEGVGRSKPLARPLRSWGQVKASVAEEE